MSRARPIAHLTACSVLAALLPVAPAPAAGPAPPQEQLEAYEARRPKTILELQPYRETSAGETTVGGSVVRVTLVNLHPGVNRWLLLSLEGRGAADGAYHLQNVDPSRGVRLDPADPTRLELAAPVGAESCALLDELASARASGRSFAPLCGGRLLLRNPTVGHKTNLEWTTDFLRDHVWGGERITTLVRQVWFHDAYRQTSGLRAPDAESHVARPPGAPAPLLLDPRYEGHTLDPAELGLELEGGPMRRVPAGRWIALAGVPGIFVSVLTPGLVAREVVASQRERVSPLDEVEASALVYLVAFDVGEYELEFAVGTDHPRVEWSDRVPDGVRDDRLPGPDGIGTTAPLVTSGLVPPHQQRRVTAAFAGGFKRRHGAFRYGALAQRNQGSHYGIVENGAVLSRLQPGLATLWIGREGEVGLGSWPDADPSRLLELRHARQNGVPILEWDPTGDEPRPGALVRQWGAGNWSGSQDQRFRTLRSGACLQEEAGRRFLVYGYFSSATPSAMARVFQAARCRYAMLLDMNALEHTYLAVYRAGESGVSAQHLVRGMEVLDKMDADGSAHPRFLGYADNRDFFYLLRRSP